jgi:hypothetical protein
MDGTDKINKEKLKMFEKKNAELQQIILEIMDLDKHDEIILTKEEFITFKLPLLIMSISNNMMSVMTDDLINLKI